MRVLICGDRNWGVIPKNLREYTPVAQVRLVRKAEAERARLRDWCDGWMGRFTYITEVIEGEAKGADTFGRVWAESRRIPVKPFPALWHTEGKAAGPLRNQRQLDEGQPEMGFAFHNNLLESRGTADMVRRLVKAHVPTWVIALDSEERR